MKTDTFEIIQGQGWMRGFGNLLKYEMIGWWGTKKWWVQSLMWLAIIDGITAITMTSGNIKVNDAIMLYLTFSAVAAFAVIIKAQSLIIGEKTLGTAVWILSKPVSRTAFILSKLSGNVIGIFGSIVLIPGIIAYFMVSLHFGNWLPVPGFIAAMGLITLFLMFFLALTLMLGTFFNNRGPVIGIPIALFIMQSNLIQFFPVLGRILPWTVLVPGNGGSGSSVASAILNGLPADFLPAVLTAAFSVIFTVIAIYRFGREEL